MAAAEHEEFAGGFDPAAVKRSAIRVLALLGVLLLIGLLTPGLGELRHRIGDAEPGWLVLAVLLEAASALSYVAMLKPIFLRDQSWWVAQRLGWSELAMGSIMPTSGVAGLALGAWIFNRVGANSRVIARRSIAFYTIKGSINFVAVAVVGIVMFCGVGPHFTPWLTIFPAICAIALIIAVSQIRRLGPGKKPPEDARRARQVLYSGRGELIKAVAETGAILKRGEPAVYLGTIGYWFWDNLVIWATFAAFGEHPAITVILMAYLIGQLGGLIPVPGGIGGVDGGLVGAYVVYGVAAGPAFIAVLTYRVILFWLPLLVGAVAFLSIQKRVKKIEEERAELEESSPTAEAASPVDAPLSHPPA
ncbi:MAG: YbhN family protein [Solirubrobacteraceae bacterium]|nr:YbhN family protein [Patulibacter sp.]